MSSVLPSAGAQSMREYLRKLSFATLLEMCKKNALLSREMLEQLLIQHFASPCPSPAPSPLPSTTTTTTTTVKYDDEDDSDLTRSSWTYSPANDTAWEEQHCCVNKLSLS